VFTAFGTHREIGAAVLPFQQNIEGSTVFLPFKADLLVCAKSDSSTERNWKHWKWTDAVEAPTLAKFENGAVTFHIPRAQLGLAKTIDCVVYAKDLSVNDGWGRLFGCSDAETVSGAGDKYIPHHLEINLSGSNGSFISARSRLGGTKFRIYQTLVRLF